MVFACESDILCWAPPKTFTPLNFSTGLWWGRVCKEKSKCDLNWNVRWAICGGEALGKSNFTPGSSPGFAPWPAGLGSIWVALDGSWGLPDGTFPLTVAFYEAGQIVGSGWNKKEAKSALARGFALHYRMPRNCWLPHRVSAIWLMKDILPPLHFCLTQGQEKKNSSLNKVLEIWRSNNSKWSFSQGFGRDADSVPQR